MRYLIALAFLAAPAHAWEAFSDGPVCVLSHDMEAASVAVTHDPRRALPYAIEVRRAEPWPLAPTFAMRFDGPGRLTISTDRHSLSDENRALTVMDRGFGNVLTGLEANFVAIAVLGNEALAIPLTGAKPEVAKFRACAQGAGV
ncbi:MAG: hypothetical protein AAF762_09445 [Pseudomonadota bacterium]